MGEYPIIEDQLIKINQPKLKSLGISHNFFGNGTILKIASEINLPLKAMTRFVEDLGTLLDNVLQALIVSKNVVNIIVFYI